jgi:glucose-6-phosphate 1-dehydrogenase
MKNNRDQASSIVIFGAKGDLTRRKLIPALYNLFLGKYLQHPFRIICVDFVAVEKAAFKQDLMEGVNTFSRNGKADFIIWSQFAAHLHYIQGDFMKPDTFIKLKASLVEFDKLHKQRAVRMYYCAVAPRFIEPIAEALHQHQLCNKAASDRIVIEKPFGTDLISAQKLNRFLTKRFAEKQLYRIDHYLGKETVQNILAFRFANYVFEPLWTRKHIEFVQISVAEEVGVGARGGYYDASGAIRDMIQNHLLQLLCVIAMEPPAKYDPETIRDGKARVLKSIRRYTAAEVFKNFVRAQYSAGEINKAAQVAYRNEEKVVADSNTETFVAAKLFIDNERWRHVPFFLRTGKLLERQSSVIVIQFKDSPHKIFKDDIEPNRLVISLQPEQQISFLFEGKRPGLDMKLATAEMDFLYKDAYSEAIPEAYETLLLDVLEGDATLFMRADQVEAAWRVVMPVINAWKKQPRKQLLFYKPGSWGPLAATKLLKPFAKEWYLLPEEKKGMQS